MYKRLHIKQPSRHILNKLESSRQIFEYTQTSNIMKIRPVGEEVSLADGHTDGRTYMMKPIVAFRNFAIVPKNEAPRCVFFSSALLGTYFPFQIFSLILCLKFLRRL